VLQYPGARWTPLGAQTQDPMARHDIVCAHTMAGYLVSTDQYFRIGNGEGYRGTESHYGIGGQWGPDLGGKHTVGEWWSTTPSKDCPTAVRITQFKTIVIPAVQAALKEDDMPLTDADVAKVTAAVLTAVHKDVAAMLSDGTHTYLPPVHRKLDELERAVQALAELKAPATASGATAEQVANAVVGAFGSRLNAAQPVG
jgi:hypothetical protein